MIIFEIQSDIRTIEENLALYKEINFVQRADAIDFIEFHIIDRVDGLLQNGSPTEGLDTIKQHANKVKHELEKIDLNLFIKLREKIRRGVYAGSSSREMLDKYLGPQIDAINHPA